MKLYVKQKVFSLGDKLTVCDETGKERYFVKGKAFSLGKKLNITDASGNDVLYLHQKLLSFKPRIIMSRLGEDFASVIREITLANPRYTVEGLGWEVTGNFLEHEYAIKAGDRTVATVSKHWMTWGDSYELDVVDDADERNAVGVLIAVDAIVAIQNAASSSDD